MGALLRRDHAAVRLPRPNRRGAGRVRAILRIPAGRTVAEDLRGESSGSGPHRRAAGGGGPQGPDAAHGAAGGVTPEGRRRLQRRAARSRNSRSPVTGSSVISIPSGARASATALATAAGAPIVPPSPTPLKPPSVVGEGRSTWWTSIAGTSPAVGTR